MHPVNQPRPGTPVTMSHRTWTPNVLSQSLKLWLNAHDANTDQNGLVQNWPDRSDGNHVITPVTGSEPVLDSTLFPGDRPGLGGEEKLMNLPNLAMPETFTAFAVMWIDPTYTPVSLPRYLVVDGSDPVQGRRPMLHGRTIDNSIVVFAGETKFVLAGQAAAFLLSIRRSATGTNVRINGTEAASDTTPIAGVGISSAPGTLGSENTNAFWAELMLFDQALDIADLQQAEGWLAHHWDLVSALPSDHPHSS